MAKWQINGHPIQAPSKKKKVLDIASQTHKTLDGSYSRDYIGNEKMVLQCEWENISLADYQVLSDARDRQINSGLAVRLTISETGFTYNAMTILHLPDIDFHLPNHYSYRHLAGVIFYQLDAVS
jgi:hypothetical protein